LSKISIFKISGTQILEMHFEGEATIINISNLPKRQCFIHTQNDKGDYDYKKITQ